MPFAHFRVGLDYTPPRGWADFDAVGVADDFTVVAGLGLDLVRVALPWEFLCPTADRASQVAMGKLLALLDTAGSRGLSVVPALFEGSPAYLAGRSVWAQEASLRAQVRQSRQLGERFRGHQAICAWDIGSAPDRAWGVPDADAAWLWAHTVCAEFRRLVPQPVILALASDAAPWPDVREHVDYAAAPTAAGSATVPAPPGIGRWPQDPLVPAFRTALAASRANRPAMALGIDPEGSENPAATYYREALEALHRAGGVAAFASHARLCRQGGLKPYAEDLSTVARARRPLGQVPESVKVDLDRFRADPHAALKALFHEFAV